MMKQKCLCILMLALVGILFVTGCNQTGIINLKMGTGGTTGTYYAFGGVVANVLNEQLDRMKITVQSTGASKANIFLIDDEEIDLAIVQNDVMDYAYHGIGLFSGDGEIRSFQAVAGLYAEVCQIVGTDGINSIEDLRGKRVSVGDAGSGVEFNARQILEVYGISFGDIKVQNLGFSDSADAFKDGKIDAFFCTAGAPTTAIVELSTTKQINLLSIDDTHAEQLIKAYPFYSRYAIPTGTYNGVQDDIMTIAVKATLIASEKLTEDTIYTLIKELFENKAAITSGHAKGEELDTIFATESIPIPFHPGAERYFREAGVL